MSKQRRPELRLWPNDGLTVTTGQPFEIRASVKNTTGVIDAFDVNVLGVAPGACEYLDGRFVALFPNSDDTVTIRVTLPDDYPAGETKLWIKASSQAAPAIDVVDHIPIYVEQNTRATIRMFPNTLVADRTGRFGVTVANVGNGPLNVALDPADGGNDFEYRIAPPTPQMIEAGDTVSFQVVLTGRRPITGAAVPKPFAIVPTSDGVPLAGADDQPLQLTGAFAPKPFVSTMVLAFAGFIGLMALWAVVVGAAINAIVDDSDADLSNSIENGMQAVVDNLTAEEDAAATAANDVLAADGVDPSATAGLSGEAVGVTIGAAATDDDLPPMNVAPNEFAGTLTAASDDSPLPGGKVAAQALLGTEFTQGTTAVMVPDPNRPTVVAVADENGRFSIPNLLPGAYDVTISVPGFVERVCSGVTIPASTPAAANCVVAGEPYSDGLVGDIASVAGVITVDGSPLLRTADNDLQVTLSRLRPIPGDPEGTADPSTSNLGMSAFQIADDFQPIVLDDAASLVDGRFSFVLDPFDPPGGPCGSDAAPCYAATPGTFELVVESEGYSTFRQLVQLAAGQKLIGIEVPLVPPLPNARPADERILSGRVTDDPTGDPLQAVTITAVGPSATYTLSTNAAGEYRVIGVPTDSYSVTFDKDDYLSQTVQQSAGDADAPGVSVSLVPAPGRLSGTVTDADSGLAVADASVRLQPRDGSTPPSPATTDVDGYYSMRDLPPGAYDTTFTPPTGSVYSPVTGVIRISPNGDRIADIALRRETGTRLVSGTVLDRSSDAPLSGVVVTITGDGGPAPTTTDATGFFQVDDLDGLTSYTLTFDGGAIGFSTARQVVRLDKDEQDRTLAIELVPNPPVGRADLVVTDIVSGRPLGGVNVSITPPITAPITATDSNGWTSFTTLEPGTTYTITVDGFDQYIGATRTVRVREDEPERTLAVALQPGFDIAGNVTVPVIGTPLSDVTVTAAGPTGTFATGTEVNGTFGFEGLPPGVYSLTFSKPLLQSKTLTVDISAGDDLGADVTLI